MNITFDGSRQDSINRIEKSLLASGIDQYPLPNLDVGVYIYGAGDLGRLALEYCQACEISVLGVLDQFRCDELYVGSNYFSVMSPDQVPQYEQQRIPIFVAIANLPIKPIIESLKLRGWRLVLPFYALAKEPRIGHPLLNGWQIGEVENRELNDVKEICWRWADVQSLEHYESFILWRINYVEFLPVVEPIKPESRYVIEEVQSALKKRRGQLVDIGSHLAQMPKRLREHGIEFEEYLLIEPDSLSRKNLQSEVNKNFPSAARVNILAFVLDSQSHHVGFAEGLGYCSQIWPSASSMKMTQTLDSLELHPDLVKIHTEGSEFEILMGGKDTINNHKPVLIFTVYHNRSGFCEAIISSMKSFLGYSWYFRLHSFQGTGAVVYGIPNV